MTFDQFCCALEPCDTCEGTGVYLNPDLDDDGNEIPGAETAVACPVCDDGTCEMLDRDVARRAYDALVAAGVDLNRIVYGGPALRLVKP